MLIKIGYKIVCVFLSGQVAKEDVSTAAVSIEERTNADNAETTSNTFSTRVGNTLLRQKCFSYLEYINADQNIEIPREY